MRWDDIKDETDMSSEDARRYGYAKFLKLCEKHSQPPSGYNWALWQTAFQLGNDSGVRSCRRELKLCHEHTATLYLTR